MAEDRKNFNSCLVVIGGFIIMALLHSMIQTCFSLFMIPVVEEMNTTRTMFSFCTGLVGIASAFLAPTMGRLLGKSKYTKKIFIMCIIGMGLSYASYGFAKEIWYMYISAALVGAFSCGAISMPISIIIANWFKNSRGLAMSIALSGSGIGGSIITPILTQIIENRGWQIGFISFGIAIIIIGVPVAWLFMPTTPASCGYEPDFNDGEQPSLPLKWLRKQPFFYVYLIGMFAISFVGYGSLSHLGLYLADAYDARFSGAIISFFLLILTPAKIALGYIYDKWGVKISSIVIMMFHSISFLMLLISDGEPMMFVMAVFFSVGISNGTVAPSVVPPLLFGTQDYGIIFGYVYSFCMLGMVAGSPFIALIYDMTGTYMLAWSTCLALCILSIACLVYTDDRCKAAVEEGLVKIF